MLCNSRNMSHTKIGQKPRIEKDMRFNMKKTQSSAQQINHRNTKRAFALIMLSAIFLLPASFAPAQKEEAPRVRRFNGLRRPRRGYGRLPVGNGHAAAGFSAVFAPGSRSAACRPSCVVGYRPTSSLKRSRVLPIWLISTIGAMSWTWVRAAQHGRTASPASAISRARWRVSSAVRGPAAGSPMSA